MLLGTDRCENGEGGRGTGDGGRGTGNGGRGTGEGGRGTGNGEWGTENGERRTGNGERGTGNGERGTGNVCAAVTHLRIQNGGERKRKGKNMGKCEEVKGEFLPAMPPDDQYVLVRADSDWCWINKA